MRFISVFHVLSALVLATAAAPVIGNGISTANTTEKQKPDLIQTIDIPNVDYGNVEEAEPETDAGCVIA
ncbi:hypothetical protein DFH08DRAFT_964007 [Mycena albidolilacea]|uniref:Uncharacterized protein n=1 Tax=Mycena albidolilacea TaxID=1033008 RepID=A0AAD7ENS7_9AGAR|nr:hypothetical protein DFH08DRAFT_964007 [Mycena albidolilacea]